MASPTASDRRPRAASWALLAALTLAPAAARAQGASQGSTLAQSLFDRARVLMDQGQFAEACPLLVESQRLDPAGGTLTNIAVCWEGAGRLATANEAFHAALGQAIKDARADRKAIAEERIAALAPRLSLLTVEVPPTSRVPDLTIVVDGAPLAPVAWGVPAAVDGGEHRVDAKAPGHLPWTTVVRVADAGGRTRLVIPPLERAGRAAADAPRPVAPAVDDRVCPPGMRVEGDTCVRLPRRPGPRSHISTPAWITGGIGTGLLAFGSIAGVVAIGKDGEAEAEARGAGCNTARDFCSSTGGLGAARGLADDAETWGWISTVSMAVGGTSLFVAMLFPYHRDPAPRVGATRAGASLWASPAGGGVTVSMPLR